MAVDLYKLQLKMEADNAKLIAQLEQANNRLSRFERSAKSAGTTFKNLFVGIASGLAVGGLLTHLKSTADEMDRLYKSAQAAGTTVETFSALNYAAELSGVETERLSTAMARLSVNAADAARGTGQAKDVFKTLGIDVTDTSGRLKSVDVLMGEIADRFASFRDESTKTAFAYRLMGQSGTELIPMLNAGSDGLRAMTDEARDFGRVVSTDAAQAAERFNDNLARIQASTQGLEIALVSRLAEPLSRVTDAMAAAARESGVLKAAWVALGGLGAYLFTDEFDTDVERLNDLRIELSQLQRRLRESEGKGLLHKWLYGDEFDLNTEIDETVAQIDALRTKIETGLNPPTKDGDKPSGVEPPRLTPKGNTAKDQQRELEEYFREFDDMVEANARLVAKENQEYQNWIENQRQLAQSIHESINPMERLERKLQELDVLLEGGFFGEGQQAFEIYAQAVQNAWEDVEEKTKQSTDSMSIYAEQAARNMQDAFADFLFDPFADGVDGMEQAFADAIRRMVANAASAKFFEGISGITNDLFGFKIPGFASGTDFAPGGLAIVGEQGPELVHLPRGSRVTPNNALGTTVNVINNTSARASVRRSNDASGREIVDIVIGEVAASIASGGTVGQAMQSTYGLSRRGVIRT